MRESHIIKTVIGLCYHQKLEIILKYKESQELIEWRESFSSLQMCLQIEAYGRLRREWFIGPVQCKFRRAIGCQCQPQCLYMMIYRHYWDLNGDRKQLKHVKARLASW